MGASGTGVPFGRYAIRARLGRGGMGEVFLADQLGPRGPVRPVALKRVLPRLSKDDAAVELFLSEMQTAAQLNHPNIATTYDFGEVDGVFFLAMEYVEGVTLDRLLAHGGPLPAAAALRIARTVAGALAHAHEQGLVHQDVSPHNVMISRQGAVKLLDFGIARAEAAVLEAGVRAKIAYAAPEQLAGAAPDRRFDLWSLGVVLYEALTRRRPFEEEEHYRPLADADPALADIDPIVRGALEPDPARRWLTAEALEAALGAAASKRPLATERDLAALVEPALSASPRVDLSETSATGVAAIDRTGIAALERGPLDSETATTAPPRVAPTKRAPLVALGVLAALILGAAGVWWAATSRRVAEPAVVTNDRPDDDRRAAHTFDGGAPIAAPAVDDNLREALARPAPERSPATDSPSVDAPRRPDEAVEVAKADTKRDRTPTRAAKPSRPGRDARPRRRIASHRGDRDNSSRPSPTPDAPAAAEGGLGLLSVRTTPWAKVALDGRALGEGVIARAPVPIGRHVLTLRPGEGAYETRTVTFVVRSGVTTKIFADLRTGTVRVEP